MKRPIGFFDSGFGGLTVMRELMRLLPQENLIYLGDTAHLPYGNKSPQTIIQYALKNASFLLAQEIKLLIVPCHTACCHAIQILQKELPIPVIGVIEAGLELVKMAARVAILGTTSTIESGLYQSLIRKQNPAIEIFARACPLFVPLIEEGFHCHPSMELIAKTYLGDLKNKVDAALLACTHYPLILGSLQKVLGPQVLLLEPAELCAKQAKEALARANLLNVQTEKPTYQFYATDDPEKFRRLGKAFFGSSIEKVEKNKNL